MPTPPSFRDFFTYEEHVAKGFELRGAEIPEAWFEQPVFYFSNPASIRGPGDEVARPPGCTLLDFELEIAAVIGAEGEIAGFTLLNDWSARDFQIKEMTVGLGPAKGKDFATSLGPMLVTPDELPYEDGRLQLEATVVAERRGARAAATRPSSTTHGRRSSSTPRATPSCAPATCSARARSAAAACWSWARWRATAGSSPATWSR